MASPSRIALTSFKFSSLSLRSCPPTPPTPPTPLPELFPESALAGPCPLATLFDNNAALTTSWKVTTEAGLCGLAPPSPDVKASPVGLDLLSEACSFLRMPTARTAFLKTLVALKFFFTLGIRFTLSVGETGVARFWSSIARNHGWFRAWVAVGRFSAERISSESIKDLASPEISFQ